MRWVPEGPGVAKVSASPSGDGPREQYYPQVATVLVDLGTCEAGWLTWRDSGWAVGVGRRSPAVPIWCGCELRGGQVREDCCPSIIAGGGDWTWSSCQGRGSWGGLPAGTVRASSESVFDSGRGQQQVSEVPQSSLHLEVQGPGVGS